MKIEICGGDGALHQDGLPRLVILKVTREGKTMDLPYPADKKIQDIFRDVEGANDIWRQASLTPPEPSRPVLVPDTTREDMHAQPHKPAPVKNQNKMEPGDTVRLSKIPASADDLASIDPNGILVLNKEFRIMPDTPDNFVNGERISFDVVDDKSQSPMRIAIPPSWFELAKKGPGRPKPRQVFEQVVKCDKCGDENCLELIPSLKAYVGNCGKCGQELLIDQKEETLAPAS